MINLRKMAILAIVFGLLLSCQTTPSPREKELSDAIANRDSELQRANATITGLEATIADLKTKLAALESELGTLSKGASALTQTRDELTRDRDALRARSGELESMIAGLNARLSSASAQIDDLKTTNRELTESRDTLSQSMSAKQDALSATIAILTKEKDELVKRVNELTIANDTLQASIADQARKLADTVNQLKKQLKVEVERGDVDIIQYRDVIIINIKDYIGFQPDSANLKPEFGPILKKIAVAFDKFPDKVIRVEGHTAVAPSRWSNSWDLGAARAVSVVRYFQEKSGVDPSRLVALSFGEFRPLAPNATEAQRQKNRRVEIVLVDRPLYQVQELIQSGTR